MLISEIYHPHPTTISEDRTIAEALKGILTNDHNGYVVVNDKREVSGVLSVQDIAGATIPKEFRDNIAMANAMYKKGFFIDMCKELKDKKVKDLMRKDFIKVTLESNIMAIMADFLKNDLYIVPVVANNELIGIITRTEIKKALAKGIDVSIYE